MNKNVLVLYRNYVAFNAIVKNRLRSGTIEEIQKEKIIVVDENDSLIEIRPKDIQALILQTNKNNEILIVSDCCASSRNDTDAQHNNTPGITWTVTSAEIREVNPGQRGTEPNLRPLLIPSYIQQQGGKYTEKDWDTQTNPAYVSGTQGKELNQSYIWQKLALMTARLDPHPNYEFAATIKADETTEVVELWGNRLRQI